MANTGSIPSGGSVTITVNALIPLSASGTISDQGTLRLDGDVSSRSGVTDGAAAAMPRGRRRHGMNLPASSFKSTKAA